MTGKTCPAWPHPPPSPMYTARWWDALPSEHRPPQLCPQPKQNSSRLEIRLSSYPVQCEVCGVVPAIPSFCVSWRTKISSFLWDTMSATRALFHGSLVHRSLESWKRSKEKKRRDKLCITFTLIIIISSLLESSYRIFFNLFLFCCFSIFLIGSHVFFKQNCFFLSRRLTPTTFCSVSALFRKFPGSGK